MKKKIALVGASMRVGSFVRYLKSHAVENYEISGIMDVDPDKITGCCEALGISVPGYTDFERMCDELSPDLVIITTVDCFHEHYVVRALDRKIGCICEKPLCISAEQCRRILAARKRNPEVFAVASHNARYSPAVLELRKLLKRGRSDGFSARNTRRCSTAGTG